MAQYWGFDSLRPLQAQAVGGAIAGRDLLVVMPTGGGKSLCYQLPALIGPPSDLSTGHAVDTPAGLTVVISPLISLMKDQVDALTLIGYPAAALNSAMDHQQQRDVEQRVRSGQIRLLYTSPERLAQSGFRALLTNVADGTGVTRFAIDEAHCISQWGHDFRREYRQLAEMREVFPNAAFSAFTATATEAVRADIAKQLSLRDPLVLVGTFDRPNLTYRVIPKQDRVQQIAQAAQRHPNQATIVYCISRKDTETIAAQLCRMDVSAEAYHAGLSQRDRRRIHEDFSCERLHVVVATVAFGMGIDRSDVRCVVHESLPRSIESFQQETGRAGRDGLPAECVLLYSSADIMRWQRLINMPPHDGQKLDPANLACQLEHLENVRRYATSTRCRHAALSRYFGQELSHEGCGAHENSGPHENSCGACDVCLGELSAVPDAHDIARKIISCVARIDQRYSQRFGGAHIADVVRGSNTQKIRTLGHDQLSTFGLLKGNTKQRVTGWIDQLVDAGHLARASGEYPVIELTGSSLGVLRNEITATLLEHEIVEDDAGSSGSGRERTRGVKERAELSEPEQKLFEHLRLWRRELSTELGVPPFVIFSNAVLEDLCRRRPSSAQRLLSVRGIGQIKVDQFGTSLLEQIAAHSCSLGLPLDAHGSAEALGP